MDYVAGFLFSHDRGHVALIEKIYPEWQRGQLNGIGGEIEPSDASPTAAMIRESEEETGMLVYEWGIFRELSHRGDVIYFFRSFAGGSDTYPAGRLKGSTRIRWRRWSG